MPTPRIAPSEPAGASRPVAGSAARVLRSVGRSRAERRTLLVAGVALLSVWLLVVFANALADASEQAARLARETQVNASLQARVAAGAVEIGTVSGSSFQDFLARSYGMGLQGERTFALAPDAPPPPVL